MIDTAKNEIQARENELAVEEGNIHDSRVRFECERSIALYEDLMDDKVGLQ